MHVTLSGPKTVMFVSSCDKTCTHAWWVEMMISLKMKSENALDCYLLASSGTASGSRQDRSMVMSPQLHSSF